MVDTSIWTAPCKIKNSLIEGMRILIPSIIYMKKFILSFLFVLLGIAIHIKAQVKNKIKVACIGAGITEGATLENRKTQSYPAQLQTMLGEGYEVVNYGVSGCTMLRKGDKPYWNMPAYKEALAYKPNIVLIDLGGND